MARAAGNRDPWWGAEKDLHPAQLSDASGVAEPEIPGRPEVVADLGRVWVVDKPAFLPTTPNGRIVRNTVQQRLRELHDNPDLVVLHRLDRLTSGLVLVSADPSTRGSYQRLFQERRISKTYEALTVMPDDWEPGQRRQLRLWLDNRPGRPGVAVLGQAAHSTLESAVDRNSVAALAPSPTARLAITEVEFIGARPAHIGDILAAQGGHATGCGCSSCGSLMQVGYWRLHPLTGRTHQLRATMDYLGYPILGEDTYPLSQHLAAPTQPRLRLLASELAFTDPIDGHDYRFHSRQTLL